MSILTTYLVTWNLSRIYTYILYIKTLGFSVCFAELIEELGSRRDAKIGMWPSNDESTIKFEDLSQMSTALQKKIATIIC